MGVPGIERRVLPTNCFSAERPHQSLPRQIDQGWVS